MASAGRITIAKLNGLVSLVTGGASGLGRGAVEHLVKRGGRVVVCDTNAELGEEVAKNLGDSAVFVQTDVTSEDQVKKAIETARSKFGQLDVAVNCAGVTMALQAYNQKDALHPLDQETGETRQPVPMERPHIFANKTLALIKPDAILKAAEIEDIILRSGFTVLQKRRVHLTPQQASDFYAEHSGKKFFQSLLDYMTSGPTIAMVLAKENAVPSWRELIGPTHTLKARQTHPGSLRAIYGTDDAMNGFHGSDSQQSAAREISFFFPDSVVEPITTGQADEDYSLDTFEKIQKVNTLGTYNVCCLAAQAMCQNQPDSNTQRGVIINTSSIAAYEGQRGQTAYAASKGAIVSLTLPLAREFAHNGIRVMTIAPGLFSTPTAGQVPAKLRDILPKLVIFPQQLGTPEIFAHLVGAIVENPYLNGEVIRLDGALRLPPI